MIIDSAGCIAGKTIRIAMNAALPVPLKSWPSVGIGLPLQGGIEHLERQDDLSSVAAIFVSVKTGEVLCIDGISNSH